MNQILLIDPQSICRDLVPAEATPGPWIADGVTLVHGLAAGALLDDVEFRQAWCDLSAACPWATPWQSFGYATAWLSVYERDFEPLLVLQRDSSGTLTGLMPLAIDKRSGALVHVGAHQAEYQGWLTVEARSDRFITEAIETLRLAYPRQRLRLHFLPPGTPVDWCAAGRWGLILRQKKRPLLALGGAGGVEKSLKKKHTRNRINRLQRVEHLRFVQLYTREQLEQIIDALADDCDLRQGALNASLPFRDDPNKREFWLRLLDTPGLAHASVLLLGEKVIAAHIGLINRTSVALGVMAHSPFVAENSPGKLLILMLGRELGQQGFRDLDLTPDGAYKDQIANHADRVHSLSLHFHPADFVRALLKERMRLCAKRLLGPRGQNLVTRTNEWVVARYQHLAHKATHRRATLLYSTSPEKVRSLDQDPLLKVNCIPDLLLYRPAGKTRRSRTEFLKQALERLEAGDRSYTLVRDGVLLHCAWLGAMRPPRDGSCRLVFPVRRTPAFYTGTIRIPPPTSPTSATCQSPSVSGMLRICRMSTLFSSLP